MIGSHRYPSSNDPKIVQNGESGQNHPDHFQISQTSEATGYLIAGHVPQRMGSASRMCFEGLQKLKQFDVNTCHKRFYCCFYMFLL